MSSFIALGSSFPGFGTIINVVAIVIGGSIGLMLKKFLSHKHMDVVMQGVGLAVMIVGLSGVFTSSTKVIGVTLSFENTLLMILSLAIGGLVGSILKINDRLEKLSDRLSLKLGKDNTSSFSEGLLTSSLLFCVGAMAIIGSLEDGLNSNSDILLSKSTLDFISAMILSSTLGAGVILSSLVVGVYQGMITLLAFVLSPLLSIEVVSQISLIGSVLIVGLALELLKLTKELKISNLLPAVIIPLVYSIIKTYLLNI